MTEVDDFLAHYGKKGMKWGQRKAARQQESQDIIDARARQEDRKKAHASAVNKLDSYSNASKYTKGQKAAEDAYFHSRNELLYGPDAKTAQKKTRGEKVADRVVMAVGGTIVAGLITSAVLLHPNDWK